MIVSTFHVQVGNPAEWFAAIGTVGAFAATWVVLRRDQTDRRRRDANEAWDSALEVTITVGPVPSGTAGSATTSVPLVTITNGGRRPIFDVAVTLSTGSEVSLGHQEWPEVPPGSMVRYRGTSHPDMWSKEPPPGSLDVFAAAVFLDVAHVGWYRDSIGTLQRTA